MGRRRTSACCVRALDTQAKWPQVSTSMHGSSVRLACPCGPEALPCIVEQPQASASAARLIICQRRWGAVKHVSVTDWLCKTGTIAKSVSRRCLYLINMHCTMRVAHLQPQLQYSNPACLAAPAKRTTGRKPSLNRKVPPSIVQEVDSGKLPTFGEAASSAFMIFDVASGTSMA